MTTTKKRKRKLDAHRDRILSGLKQGKKKIDIFRYHWPKHYASNAA
ncbi:hypothetical protein R7D64_20450 [Vibrio sp. Vb2535]|nr:hypothetical protein [Vibrio sp. Vb2535]MDW1755306.1 hypothetical protein [Vibrio sp. Vb2535]